MDIEKRIREYGSRIQPLLEEMIPRNGPAHLAGPIWYHLDSGGKRVRPALCLLTCEAFGGEPDRALHFAAAVELMHNMFLIHDDIADGDTVRRDRPTVWDRYGIGNAVNVGDYLLGVALKAVRASRLGPATRDRLTDLFIATCLTTIEGQALDINARADAHFTVEEYLRIARLKTGDYLVLGMVGGALIAGAREDAVAVLRLLGGHLGPAFQIRDDLLDLTSAKGRGMTGSDIREGKASILYAHALSQAPLRDRERLIAIMARPRAETTESDVTWVRGLYERCGSIRFAEDTARQLVEQARAAISPLPDRPRCTLEAAVAYMLERNC